MVNKNCCFSVQQKTAQSQISKLLYTSRVVARVVKNPSASAGAAGDLGLISGSGRTPGGGQGSPLQYSCLENPMDRGAWQTAVHGVAKSPTQLC